MWPGMHKVHVHMQVVNMHPVHDQQETPLNVRGGGDSINYQIYFEARCDIARGKTCAS